jgi:hypothetical protein
MWHNMILWFFWTLGSDWPRISNTSITVIFYNFFLMCPFTFLSSNYFEIYTVPLLITFTPLFLKTPELWLLSNNNVVPADWLFPLTHLYYSPWSLFYEINPRFLFWVTAYYSLFYAWQISLKKCPPGQFIISPMTGLHVFYG